MKVIMSVPDEGYGAIHHGENKLHYNEIIIMIMMTVGF
jgi:hypothetical protein